jgi:hypothetical protein
MAVKNGDAFHQLQAYDDEMAGKQRSKGTLFPSLRHSHTLLTNLGGVLK